MIDSCDSCCPRTSTLRQPIHYRKGILIDGNIFAEVIKEWTWFNKKFTLDVPGPNDYTIDGSFWEHEFTFQRQGLTVATVSRKFWAWTDSYGVDIAEGENEVAVLCACIVIDQVLHDESSSVNTSSSL